MKKHIDDAINIIKGLDINGCITGSVMLDYFEGADIDVFVYDQASLNKVLFYMHYNSMFTILEPMELHKFNDYINNGKSSLESLGLLTIKFKYNLLIDVNIVYKKFNKDIFSVLSNFDMDIIAVGYDIKTKKTLNLRETTGMVGTFNSWNPSFYKNDFWSIKRLLRQWERVVKYTQRGYDLSLLTDKYIQIVEDVIKTDNVYKSEKGVKYHTDTIEQFETVLKLLNVWKRDLKMSKEEIMILKTII